MFTGIVSSAYLTKVHQREDSLEVFVSIPPQFPPCKIGDSVAIDGTCLTISSITKSEFSFFVSSETIQKTICKSYKNNQLVNIELPLTPLDRIGGHHVLGHVDCTGKILTVRNEGASWFLSISIPPAFMKYLVYKGSIAVNGISLTINAVGDNSFELCIIPVTLDKTNVKNLLVGDIVNIEFDILAKYTEKLLQRHEH
jgi:riboflavin synthase